MLGLAATAHVLDMLGDSAAHTAALVFVGLVLMADLGEEALLV